MYSSKDPSFRGLLRRSIYFPIGLMTLLLLVLGLLVQVTTEQTRHVSRAHSVIEDANTILTMIVDGETSIRGFELTKDPRFLEPFTASKAELPKRFADLNAHLIGDPQQQQRLKTVQSLYDKWLATSMGAESGSPRLPRVTLALSQKMQMDQIRGSVADLIRAEQELLDVDVVRESRWAFVLLFVLGGGAILVGGLVSYQSARSIKELSGRYEEALSAVKSQADELRASRDELDRRVEERTRELNAANKELEVFSYSAAHDLRAPLRWIIASNRIFVEDYGKLVPPEGLEDLTRVSAAALRLSDLIDNLLEMARLGQVEIHKAPVNLSEISAKVIEELRGRDWCGDLDVEIQPDVQAVGDPLLLTVLMQNLLENGCKFCSKAPAGKVSFAAHEQGGEMVYSVTDNGVGFENEYATKLFQPFERLHRNDEFAGTGMGLANAKKIVERHGGRIWAEGKPGEGATFFFTLG